MPLYLNINSHPNKKGKTSKNRTKKESTTLKWNHEKREDFVEAIHSEDSQSRMWEAFHFLTWFGIEEIHWNSTSGGQKYEMYDMARYGPWAEIASSKNKTKWIRCRWGNIQRKKKRVQIDNIRKEKTVQNYCCQALLDNKNNKFGETVSHVRQKKKHQKINIRTWQDHFQTILGQAGEKKWSNSSTSKRWCTMWKIHPGNRQPHHWTRHLSSNQKLKIRKGIRTK